MSFRCAAGSLLLVAAASGCGDSASPGGTAATTPIYNRETGRLEQLVSDKNGDGRIDARAHMDGSRVRFIEIDRNGDGRFDRWEYYAAVQAGTAKVASVIERAEEANGADERITRREFYGAGILLRVEEDADADGRLDKWEYYDDGRLRRVDLDLGARGSPDRRLIYGRDGKVERVEADPDGDGKFELMPTGKGNSTHAESPVPHQG